MNISIKTKQSNARTFKLMGQLFFMSALSIFSMLPDFPLLSYFLGLPFTASQYCLGKVFPV